MVVVQVDRRGRIRIPRRIRIDADRALVIPLGSSYMVIPIPKTPTGLSLETSARELRMRAEGAIRREIRQHLERRGKSPFKVL